MNAFINRQRETAVGPSQRRQREKDARVEQILQAAAGLFGQDGIEAVSMAQIARQAELAPGTIYLYFRSKEELYYSLLEPQLLEHQRRNQQIAADQGLSPLEAVRRLLLESARYYLAHPGMIHLLARYQARQYHRLLSREKFQRLRGLMRSNVDILAELIGRGVERGVFAPSDPLATSLIVWNMAMGMIQGQENRLYLDKRNRGDEASEAALELMMNGLLRR